MTDWKPFVCVAVAENAQIENIRHSTAEHTNLLQEDTSVALYLDAAKSVVKVL